MKGERELMPWPEVCHYIAQGAVNVTEGYTVIEAGSRVHEAMVDFCEHVVRGTIPVRRPEAGQGRLNVKAVRKPWPASQHQVWRARTP
jgi:hypothetical protein